MSTYRLHRGYAYGYDGNRAIKMTGTATIDQTGTLLNSTNLENITIYPNEYLTVTQAEYTKYYYAGGNRIASKIGTGGFGKMTRLCTLDQSPTYNANTLLNFVLYQVTNTTQPPTDEYPVDVCGGYNVATELLTSQLPDFYISQTNLNFTQNNLLQQFRQNLTNSVEPVYYFHSDHLGSASWITSGTGAAVQHLQYLPFGEPFVNEQSTGYFERFTFTGKERDAETGYYYHGARFNNSDIGWLSVDPMSDKYPSLTPYNYCAWNPIKYIDPDGSEKILAFNINATNEKERKDNRYLQGWARAYTRNRGVIHLFAHGVNTENGINKGITTYVNGSEKYIKSPGQLFDFLMENSTIFRNHNKKGEASQTSILVMHSCSAGQEGAIAQQASEILDLLVIAPSKNIISDGYPSDPKNVKPSDYKESIKDNGVWNIYYRGEFMESFSGQTKPLFDNPQQTIEKYEKMYNERHAQNSTE